LVEKLAASGIVCSSRHDGLRLSFHVYNTLEDVRAVLQVLEQNLDLLVTGTAAVSGD
jgi:selenocysteine lyase/cysteine desulfurase